MELWSPCALGTRTELRFVIALSRKYERNYGLGMDALITVCSWNTNGIMVSAWMLWLSHPLKDEWNYGLGMDALVIELIKR